MSRPPSRQRHTERHATDRIGWLRAAVLGANDGIVSTASLIAGVAAASADRQTLLLTGVAGLVAGAMSMAAGEFVSVSAQADAEAGDLAKEKAELAADPRHELAELAGIYRARGLSAGLARQVAEELTAHDALGAHARDELGITSATAANPLQAAAASAASFTLGAGLPLAVAAVAPMASIVWSVMGASLAYLAALGALGAWAGGAAILKPTLRVTFWGAAAMAATALIGKAFGAVV